jgi:WD40 repeat protein
MSGVVGVFAAARLRLAAAILLIMVAAPGESSGQYFGGNKVLYKSQRFRILETEHFDIYFHVQDRAPVDVAATLAERGRRRVARFFDHELRGRQPIVLYSSHPDFEQTLIVEEEIGIATSGVTEGSRRRMVLSFASSLAETKHVIGHELVHAFQFDLMASRPAMQFKAGAEPLPSWFEEGLAEFLTLGPVDAHTAMWLRDAAMRDDLPSIAELQAPRRFPYRWGHALTAYVAARWGERALADWYKEAMLIGVDAAVDKVLHLTAEELGKGWHAFIQEEYVRRLDPVEPVGVPLVRERIFGRMMNVGPSLSPDARWLAFLSERDLFAIDLFVADARTGEIVRRLTDTTTDPHVSSLQFIDAAGAWDRDSRRLAVAAVTAGRPAIAIFGWPDGTRQRDIVIKDVDEISGLTWSPDGRSIAFAGLSGGVTDLFVYDLGRGTLRRLTHDAFADMQPAWSPDGRRLAFATDRFTTDTSTLAAGDFRLALVDVDTSVVRSLAAFATGKHLNPQWSADNRALFFVSDHDGISDLYRLELDAGMLTRITRAATGISGLTASSPSISVASGEDVAAVIVFTRGAFAIHMLALKGGTPVDVPTTPSAFMRDATADQRDAGFPVEEQVVRLPPYRVSRYKPRLSFEGVAPASFAVGMDRYGAAFGTGIGMAFSDMLNTHRLMAAVQVNQGVGSTLSLGNHAFYGAYVNRARRWNWGAVGSNFPTLTSVRSSIEAPDGRSVSTVSVIKQTERAATFLVSYPFNRARRLEFQSGWGRLTFDGAAIAPGRELDSTAVSAPLNFGTTSAALVSDTTSAGATSIVSGERYRFEVAPVLRALRHVSVLADYRRYLMPAPFYTIAARALHVGRYGSGADDPRLTPLYLGYPTIVRGYDFSSRVTSDCVAALTGACGDGDQLVGSKLAVGNLELRFPLLRPFGVSRHMYGPIPVEVGLFLDGGLVWRDALAPSSTGPAGAASSAGASLRVNMAGLGLSQFDIARRLQGSQPGWAFQFNLVPAF